MGEEGEKEAGGRGGGEVPRHHSFFDVGIVRTVSHLLVRVPSSPDGVQKVMSTSAYRKDVCDMTRNIKRVSEISTSQLPVWFSSRGSHGTVHRELRLFGSLDAQAGAYCLEIEARHEDSPSRIAIFCTREPWRVPSCNDGNAQPLSKNWTCGTKTSLCCTTRVYTTLSMNGV